MIPSILRAGVVAATLGIGAAQAAILDDALIEEMPGWEGTDATRDEGKGAFDMIIEELVAGDLGDLGGEPEFGVTCWDCGVEPGDAEIVITGIGPISGVVAPVPIPAAGLVLLGGLGALGLARRRRRG